MTTNCTCLGCGIEIDCDDLYAISDSCCHNCINGVPPRRTESLKPSSVNASLEGAINQMLLNDPDFCPTTERLDRYAKMAISAALKRALAVRYQECWVGFSEEDL